MIRVYASDAGVDMQKQDGVGRPVSVSKKVSLRTSPQTGVAISEVFCPVFDGFCFCFGDSHASVRTGSE